MKPTPPLLALIAATSRREKMPKGNGRGGYRWTDPYTARDSAETVDTTAREYDVLTMLKQHRGQLLNGWEMSKLLGWTTISVVPRLCPLREKGLIEQRGTRPGPPPAHKAQLAYQISAKGLAFISGAKPKGKGASE